MIVRSVLPESGYTKIDKKVFTDPKISDGAKVLYGYLCGLKSGQNFSDNYIMKALGLSKVVLSRRKKELKEYGLIYVDRVSARMYFIYIGSSYVNALAVRQQWIRSEDE